MERDAFAVWDTVELRWWTNAKGKMTWSRKCDAANAWNVGKYREPKFSEQTRFITLGVKLTVVD